MPVVLQAEIVPGHDDPPALQDKAIPIRRNVRIVNPNSGISRVGIIVPNVFMFSGRSIRGDFKWHELRPVVNIDLSSGTCGAY